jgi:hypothetical protein
MGEGMSKSQGKVYVGDVVDFNYEGQEWCVAEIISVDDNGLTVLSHSAAKGKSGKVCYLDLRDSSQKSRVKPAGTYSGNVGLTAAHMRVTTTTSTNNNPTNAATNHSPVDTIASPKTSKCNLSNTITEKRSSGSVLTIFQKRLFNKYKIDMNVDYHDGTRWLFAKIIHMNTSSNDVEMDLHVLGDSSYIKRSCTITNVNEKQKLAKFATKALL